MGLIGLILIDTNIFLEVLLGRARADDCKALLEMASEGKIESVVTHFSINSIEAIMRKRGNELASFLRVPDQTSGLYVFGTTVSDEVSASILTRTVKLDFDDAVEYHVAKKLGAEAIVSFDKDFDNLDVMKSEPSTFIARGH